MKTIKKVIFGLLSIIALLLIIALFLPKDYTVEREIIINQPNETVFEYLKYLKNQDNYSTWTKKDPNVKNVYAGTDGTVGAMMSWSGNKEVGKGEQEIKKIDEGKHIDFELRFKEPFEGVANAYFITEAIDSSKTRVKWGINGRDSYPMNIMQLVIDYDEMMGAEFDAGLNNLKDLLENQ